MREQNSTVVIDVGTAYHSYCSCMYIIQCINDLLLLLMKIQFVIVDVYIGTVCYCYCYC